MKLKRKKITIVILILLLPLATIIATNADEPTEIDMIIWLERPEKQVVVDEIIFKVESLGLSVNPIYLSFEEWVVYGQGQNNDWDLLYGPPMALPRDAGIFDLAFISVILNYYALNHNDAKILNSVDKLWGMFWDAIEYPDVVDEDFINDMVDKFQDIEERLWEKQYFAVFVQYETPFSDEWGPIPAIKTDTMTFNCLPGFVFEDTDLRLQLMSNIDLTVFLDYHSTYNPYPVYEVHHLFQWSTFHDTSLPNNYAY